MTKLTPNQQAWEALLKMHKKADIAKMIGTSRQAITAWTEIPANHVKKIHEATGIPKHQLLPDPY